MRKIVIIGAGSGFGRRLSLDIMARESLRDSTIALCDVHDGRLGKLTSYLERAVEKYDLPTQIVASTDRHELLPDADYVITSVAVGGAAYSGFPFTAEKEIPAKYGIDQSVADTIGVGGVFR
ncbi:alpha-glucosidase/alpha-galactosidase, partial [Candidatus Poribacteria bacterium]|nr:alpha-glucosidase/alpha-galactosidase [Candidatus Poribacteria bacterium]